MSTGRGDGFEAWLVRMSALWVALVLVNYSVAGMAVRGPAPRFEEIRREIMAGRSMDPAGVTLTAGSAMVLGLAVCGMIGAGLPLLRFALRRTGAGRGRIAFAWCAGFSIIGIALLGLGLTGLFRSAIAWAGLAAAVPAAIRQVRSLVNFLRRSRGVRSVGWPGVAVGAVLVALVSSSLGPETGIDSLMYHLARARHILLEGRFIIQPSFMYAFPPVWESWLAVLLATGGEQAARLLAPAVVAATAWLLAGAVDRVRPGAGSLAAAAYAASTLAVAAGSSCKSDAATGWLAAAMFAAAMRSPGRSGSGWAVVAGVAAGAGLLVKLTFAPAVAVASAWMLRAGVRRAAMTASVACGICLPWGVHGFVQYGNPVHPVLRDRSALRPPPGATENFRAELRGTLTGRYESFADRVRAIWSVAMAEGMTPLLLLLLPVVVGSGGWWGWSAVALGVLWSIGPPQPRYLLPALPLCAGAFAMWATAARGRGAPVRWRRIAVAVLVVFETGRAWFDPAADRAARWAVATGALPADGYLRLRLTTYADAIQRMNARLPVRARVLPVGERRQFPLARRFIAVRFDDPAPFLGLAAASRDERRVAVKLRQWGVTHVLYNPVTAGFLGAEAARVRPADRALQVWARCWREHAEPVPMPPRADLREGEFFIFAIRRDGAARIPPLLPGVDGWTASVGRPAAAGDRPAALDELGRVERLAGGWPALELWRVNVSGESMPAAETRVRLERARAAGLEVSHLYVGLMRAARREGRKEAEARYQGAFRRMMPEVWLRQPAAGSATLDGR